MKFHTGKYGFQNLKSAKLMHELNIERTLRIEILLDSY